MKNSEGVKEYIDRFPSPVKASLNKIRKLIYKIAPGTEETINYGIPAYKLYGRPLIYFAGYKNHIGLYATANTHIQFQKKLSKYKQGKGSVQFPLEEVIPFSLIEKIIRFNKAEILRLLRMKNKKKQKMT